jgi:hypothetical protein
MSNWIHRFFNPHCEHCIDEREDSKVCASCETLKQQLESVNHEKNRLLDRLLTPPTVETVAQPIREPTRPLNVPWSVRKQMLEREDREKAKLMRDAPKPNQVSTEDLEKELNVVEINREKFNATQ